MNIVSLLLTLLPGIIGAIPQISSGIKQIITDVSGSAAAVIQSGVVTGPSVTTILSAWMGVITVLKTDPGLPAGTLNAVAQLEKAVQAALVNDLAAQQAVDWNKIITVATV